MHCHKVLTVMAPRWCILKSLIIFLPFLEVHKWMEIGLIYVFISSIPYMCCYRGTGNTPPPLYPENMQVEALTFLCLISLGQVNAAFIVLKKLKKKMLLMHVCVYAHTHPRQTDSRLMWRCGLELSTKALYKSTNTRITILLAEDHYFRVQGEEIKVCRTGLTLYR